MAAGTVTRAHPDPTPSTPIVVEDYADELNTLVTAHNDLYNDWTSKVAKADAVIGTAASPTSAKKVVANGVTMGDYTNEITAGSTNLEDMEDASFLQLNGVRVAWPGTLIPRTVIKDTTGWLTGTAVPLTSIYVTGSANVELYSTYVFTGNSGVAMTVELLDTGTLPSASVIIPVGFTMTFVNNKTSGAAINVQWTDSSLVVHTVALAHTGNFVTLMALPLNNYVALAINQD